MTDAEIIKAKAHFEYGIKCDIFQEPVLSYAKTVLEAFDKINCLKAENEKLKNDLAISKKETKRYATKTTNHKHHKEKHCFLNHTLLHIVIHLLFHLVLHGVLEHIIH